MLKLIISSHLNPTLSGVAKFNLILSKRLGIPCLGFDQTQHQLKKADSVMLSVKLKDATRADLFKLKSLLNVIKERKIKACVFFHTFDELPIEYDIISQSKYIFCANSEIQHSLIGLDKNIKVLWCPHLVDLSATVSERNFNVFSFGMAHKLQLIYYKILFDKLKQLNIDYSLWISTAFHEKSSFGDFKEISNQLISIFGNRVNFLGFLSDEAINYLIEKVQLFVAFFSKGVRANNTSIYVPMEKGCAVLTNLDGHSPTWMRKGINILDINHLEGHDLERKKLALIAERAKIDVQKYASWELLVKIIKSEYNK